MATDPRSPAQTDDRPEGPDDARTGDADPGQRRNGAGAGTAQPGKPTPAREGDPAKGRDLPDENGEPPSVKRPGGDPEASEPPVENF